MIKFNKNNYNDRNSIFDVIGFLCLLFAGILLLSYFSINKESITLNDNISQNLLGIFGAYISVYSFLAFGYSSFIFPAFFIYVGISVILKNSSNKISLSALGSFILMILLSVFFDITLGESLFYKKGGMMGKVIGESLISLFGKTGAFVMVISGLIILTIIFAKVSIIDSLNSLKNILGKIDLKKIKDFESKIINENINKTNSDNNENEKLKTKDYLPIFYKKEIPAMSFSSIPFIEKVKQSNNYFNSFSFNEYDFREKLKRKNNSFESFFSGLKKSSDYNNDDKKI